MTARRSWVLAGWAAVLLGLASWALMQAQAPSAGGGLAEIVPSGPVLMLEAQDFSSLLQDWNNSSEKQQWLASANYQMFSRSRLFFRLAEAHNEFTAAAGFSPDMSLVESIAGSESVLALYDIGELRFLYITRLGSARALENMLWQSRANFEPRNAAGHDYFVRTDAQSGRQAVFAATDEYLLLATAEEPLAQALTLLAGQGGAAAASDAWYHDAVQASAWPRGPAPDAEHGGAGAQPALPLLLDSTQRLGIAPVSRRRDRPASRKRRNARGSRLPPRRRF